MNIKHDLRIPDYLRKDNVLFTKTTILITVVHENRSKAEETIQYLDR